MNSLKKYQFSKLYAMSSGISSKPEQAGHGAPFASFSTIFNNFFLPDTLSDKMDSSEKEQETYSIKKDDIFLTRTSETIDELGMSCVALNDYPNATFSGFVKRLRPLQNDLTYAKYMGFYLRSKFFRKTMTNNAIMTLRASLNEDIFSYLNLYLPDYKTQKKSGDLLFLLYSKIEINNRIINKLQLTTNLLYEYWFVQFDFPDKNGKPYKTCGCKMVWNEELKKEVPEGWLSCTLGDVLANTGTGLNPRDNFVLGEGENYYVTIKNIVQGRVVLDDRCDKISNESLEIINNRSDLRVGDILFTSIEPVGTTYLILEKPKNWNINESVFTIRPNYEKVNSEFLYMFLSGDYIKSYTRNVSAGSIHKGVRHSTLKECKFILPGKEVVNDFSELVLPILKKMDLIQKENQKLSELRDWLLPMLMNGQVKVG
jgi:type I restriction enzyme S subunit